MRKRMKGNWKVNWDLIWFEFDKWYKSKDSKKCSECGKSKCDPPDWQDQHFKIQQLVEKYLNNSLTMSYTYLKSVQDLLSFATDIVPPIKYLRYLNGFQIMKAIDWAGAVHFNASDNNNKVPERPKFLDKFCIITQRNASIRRRKNAPS
jgi:hypothetical protein